MNKQFILVACLISLVILSNNANAATVTWTGGGSDNLASNPANWLGNLIPQYGDNVIFDSTSKNCTWDLTVDISSLTINSGYTGKVTISSTSTLTIAITIKWTGVADNLASNPANWSDNRVPQNGDKIVFDDTSSRDCVWDMDVTPAFLSLTGYTKTVTLNSNLTINGPLTITSGTLNLNNKSLNVDGYILIGISGILNGTPSTITVKGDWTNYGTFIPDTSTIILNGANQAIYGNNTFYNLTKTVTSADALYFQAGSIQTISNNLTLTGTSGELLSLMSTSSGSYWYVDLRGSSNVSYVNISDLYNLSFSNIIVTNSVDSGHNNNVSFGGSECVTGEGGGD